MKLLAKLLVGPLGPWLLLGLTITLVGAAWWVRQGGHEAGVLRERQTWQQVAQRARDQADQLAHERQARKDEAASARAERDRLYAMRVAPIRLEVQRYERSPAGAVRCVDSVGLRLGQQAIAAANAAIASPTG